MFYLKQIEGPTPGRIWELKGPRTVLGRHPDCDVEVNIAQASRHHAQVVFVNGDYFLEDLHSRNGTFLNDAPIRDRKGIGDGDRIRLAEIVFTFHHQQPPESATTDGSDEPKVKARLVDEEGQPSNLIVISKLDPRSSQCTNLSQASLEAQLGALLEITQNLYKTLELDEVLPKILDSLFVIFPPADRGFVVLEDDDGKYEVRWAKIRGEDATDTLHISRTIVKQVMESQEATLSADASDDERFQPSKSLSSLPIRSMMCAPLIDKEGRSFGAVQIDALKDRSRFREEDLEVLCSVATQTSVAVDNARLHERILRQQAFERELELAHQIQRSFLPEQPPQVPGYEFFDYCQPTNRVGGDFYDYVPLPDGRLAVVVADVVGHGVAAAMLTAKLAAQVRYELLSTGQPVEAVKRLNVSLAHDLLEDHFVTLVLAVLSPETGNTTIVNAGHMRPILRRSDGRVSDVGFEQAGLPLGIAAEIEYEQCEVQLSPGDLLGLYTDGINDSTNDADQMYGIDRLKERIAVLAGGPRETGQGVIDDLRGFINGCPQNDDMCLLCFSKQ